MRSSNFAFHAGLAGILLLPLVAPCRAAAPDRRDPRPPLAHEEALAAMKLPDPTKAYQAALRIWGDGYQSVVESMLPEMVRLHPKDARLAFFRAACVRSRFNVNSGRRLFQDIAGRWPETVEGRCAAILVRLDGEGHEQALPDFYELLSENPEDPLLLWMGGVICRTHRRNEEGVSYYQRLLKQVTVGPVLLHQTYANLLDDVGQYDEALKHRIIAIQLEPASWSWQAMGNTLNSLRRWAAASEAYLEAAQLPPADPECPRQCAEMFVRARMYREAAEWAQKALEIDRNNPWSLRAWALSLCELGDYAGAKEKMASAERVQPKHWYNEVLKTYINGRAIRAATAKNTARTPGKD